MNRLLIIILLILCSFLLSNTTSSIETTDELKFKLVRTIAETRLPIATLDINGREYNFLIASGISICIIDIESCERNNLKIIDSKKPGKVITFGGVSTYNKEVRLMNHAFYVQDMSSMSTELQYHTGVKVDGLIGCSLLSDKKAIINFQQELISMTKKQ